MNTWTSYIGGDPGGVDDRYISLVFGQEIGHAWLAFVHFDRGGASSDTMLGRSVAHWSFYLNSGGSPIEGHDWLDNGDGTFTATKHEIYEYSDLDLYLMGLLPADQVEPWFLFENPSNCVDSAAKDGGCAPADAHQFEAESYTVTADRRDLTVEDVIAVEGPRTPAWPDAPDAFDVSFLLVTRTGEELEEGDKLLIDAIVNRAIEIFDRQTRGFGRIRNRTASQDGTDTGAGETDADETDAGSPDTSTSMANATADDMGAEVDSARSEATGQGAGQDAGAAGGCGCVGAQAGGTGGLWLLVYCVPALLSRRRPGPRRLRDGGSEPSLVCTRARKGL